MAEEWTTEPGLEEFPLDPSLIMAPRPPKKQRRIPNCNRFIHGPLSMEWLSRVNRLPGNVLWVALIIRHLEGLNRGKRVSFPLSNVEAARWGVHRNVKNRALTALDKAGLIAVERKHGASPRVTVIELKPNPTTQSPPR
jgi:hypothetical protein